MSYNATNLTSISNFGDLVGVASDATNGLFYGLIISVLFITLIVKLQVYGPGRAVAAASLTALFLTLPLLWAGMLTIVFPIVFGTSLGLSLFYIMFSET